MKTINDILMNIINDKWSHYLILQACLQEKPNVSYVVFPKDSRNANAKLPLKAIYTQSQTQIIYTAQYKTLVIS